MKYQPGDKVVVRSDLKVGNGYRMEDGRGHCFFVTAMNDFLKREVTIYKIFLGGYLVEEDDNQFIWADEMFEDYPVDHTFFTAEDPSTLYGW